jgi:glycosyltransferase involved in cell wall biosynthesis
MSHEQPASNDQQHAARAVSVVVPVYNSRGTLAELVARVAAAMDVPFEVILVDDGSGDGSDGEIRRLADADPRVRGVFLMRNFGQHNALLAGIREARFPVTVTLDDDLQNPPEEIPRLVAKLGEGHDVVYGVPERVRQDLWRVAASKLIRFALRGAIGKRRAAMVSPFRAFRTDVRRAFENYFAASVSIDVLLTWGGARFDGVPVRHDARRTGRSHYSITRLVSHAINMMTGFSSWPLRFASIIGFLFTFFGLGVLAYVVGMFVIVGRSVPGFPFLASIIAIFAGAQLFALGIIGEYLAKVHFRMMDRPPYVIASSTGISGPADA